MLRNGNSLTGTSDLTTGTLDWSGGAQSGTGTTNVTTANNIDFSFSRNDESETEVALVFQYGTDLIHWTDLPIDAVTTAPVIIAENGASPDAITIAIPQENRAALFGRLRAVK